MHSILVSPITTLCRCPAERVCLANGQNVAGVQVEPHVTLDALLLHKCFFLLLGDLGAPRCCNTQLKIHTVGILGSQQKGRPKHVVCSPEQSSQKVLRPQPSKRKTFFGIIISYSPRVRPNKQWTTWFRSLCPCENKSNRKCLFTANDQ